MSTKTQEIPEKTQSESNTQAEPDADVISWSNDRSHSFELDMERRVLDSVSEIFDAGQDELDYQSEGPVNLPEDSVVDTESDGQGYVYEQSDGDHEDDEDYIMDDPTDALYSDDGEEFDVNIEEEELNVDIQAEAIAKNEKGKGKKVKPFFHLH